MSFTDVQQTFSEFESITQSQYIYIAMLEMHNGTAAECSRALCKHIQCTLFLC